MAERLVTCRMLVPNPVIARPLALQSRGRSAARAVGSLCDPGTAGRRDALFADAVKCRKLPLLSSDLGNDLGNIWGIFFPQMACETSLNSSEEFASFFCDLMLLRPESAESAIGKAQVVFRI